MTEIKSLIKNKPLVGNKLQFIKKNIFHNKIHIIRGKLPIPGIIIKIGIVQTNTISKETTKIGDFYYIYEAPI